MKTETIEEFLARGGKIQVVKERRTPPKLTRHQSIAMMMGRKAIAVARKGEKTKGQLSLPADIALPMGIAR